MAATASTVIQIRAEDRTSKAFKSVRGNLDKTDRSVKATTRNIVKFGSAMVAMAGAYGLGRLVTGTLDAVDKIDKLSVRLGVSTEALSEYKHVADIAGVSFETLTMGWQRMTRRVAEAANGMGEAKDALKELGLDAKKLNELPLDTKFEIIADKLAGLTSESDRVRLAMKLFDSEGVALVQTMQDGAEGIREVREEAVKLKLSLGRDQVNAAKQAKDAWVRLTGAFSALSQILILDLAPPATELVNWLAVYLPRGIKIARTWWFNFNNAIAKTVDTIVLKWKKLARGTNEILLIIVKRMREAVVAVSEFSEALGYSRGVLLDVQKTLTRWETSMEEANKTLTEEIKIMEAVPTVVNASTESIDENIRSIDDWTGSMQEAELGSDSLAKTVEENMKTIKEISDNFTEGLKTSWQTMWEDLFTGKGIDSVKDFLKAVKNLFLKTFAEIIAKWSWDQLFGSGTLGLGDIISGVLGGSKVAGASKSGGGGGGGLVGAAVSKIFGTGTTSSGLSSAVFTGSGSGTLFNESLNIAAMESSGITAATGGTAAQIVATEAAVAGETIVSTAATTGSLAGKSFIGKFVSGLAGFAVPLAIFGFGMSSIRKRRKEDAAEFNALMADATVQANLHKNKLIEGFHEVGSTGSETYMQMSDSMLEYIYNLDNFHRSQGFGLHQLVQLRDEYGNVIVRVSDYDKFLAEAEFSKPFIEARQAVLEGTTAVELQREGIGNLAADYRNKATRMIGISDEMRGKMILDSIAVSAGFTHLGKTGVEQILAIDRQSQKFRQYAMDGTLESIELNRLGLVGLGETGVETFEQLVTWAQIAAGKMTQIQANATHAAIATQALINAQENAITGGSPGGGMQHGGSFIVGGRGGTDSTHVGFNATPGERVTVETPAQQRANRGGGDGSVVRELRALRADLATVVARPIVGAVTRGQLAMAGGARH